MKREERNRQSGTKNRKMNEKKGMEQKMEPKKR